MFCAISGNVPEEPVVSKKTGHLFERRLVEKYVAETGKCPVTQGELAADDLLPLAASKTAKPRVAPAASIPGMLGLFHDEWDALMLETHALRQALHTSRQELSHALYQHDAACRVIARLMRERDEARGALDSMRETLRAEFEAKKRTAEDAEEEEPSKRAKAAGIPQAVLDEMAEVNAALSKARKKRAVADSVATPEEVAAFGLVGSFPVHKAGKGGILDIDLHPKQAGVAATAGADGTVQLFDVGAQLKLASLQGHTKRVNGARFAGATALVTGSADKTVRVWRAEGEGGDPAGGYKCAAVLSEHAGEVVSVTVHPGQRHFVSASADASWAFWDVEGGACLKQVAGESAYTSAQFHPDGLILATGAADKVVRIWEMRGQKNVAQFEGHSAPVTSLSFSENGYHLATAAADGVKLWDLRKLKNFKMLSPYDGAPCTCVAFDHSGLYLAVGGPDARVYGSKQEWAPIKEWSEVAKKGVTALKAGPDMRSLLVGGADHNLRVFGAAQ
ncbi:MAG: spliceosome component, nuclear pre-mRNA splicing factor [Monoraphidium minutum]|nr:MAG: spliceosome component, nuclear pre-mRNA splicing factor [Monoraphidium minutum]